MIRRAFLSACAALGLAPLLPKPKPKPKPEPVSRRPWAKRADELWPVEGHWSDYAAWIEWIDRKLIDSHHVDIGHEALIQDGYLLSVELYVAFCEAYDADAAP